MPKYIEPGKVLDIYQEYLTYGSMEKTARALDIPLHKVKRAVYQATGRCLCGRAPRDGYLTCDHCLERARHNTKKRQEKRAKARTCRECDQPLANGSKRFCTAHLKRQREQQRELRKYRQENNICRMCKTPAVEGKAYCETHLPVVSQNAVKSRSRYQFGGLLEAVLERDENKCRICHSDQPRVEVHHIRGRVNTMDNLITLCVYCHKAVTFLNYCNEPDAVYAWFLEHKP